MKNLLTFSTIIVSILFWSSSVMALNLAPIAHAGSDKTVTLPSNSVTLYGSGTDTDGTISKYQWTKVSGGTVSFSSTSNATITVSSLVQGNYTFRLTVTDNLGATGSDDMNVYVNTPPVANAGTDKKIGLPTNSVTLSGSATDSDGTIARCTWTKVSGGNCTIDSPLSMQTSVSNLVEGSYTFRLSVKDNRGASDTDDVNVSVLSAPRETLRYKGTVTGANYGYSEYVPEGYTEYSNWPLIIFLHGIGETNKPDSNGKSTNLSSVGKFGPIHYASPTRLNHKLPSIILAPQCDKYWSVSEIEKFRVFALGKYKVNSNRVYLTGLSMGGGGTYNYANSYGQNLAAVMAMSPAGTLNSTGAQKLISIHAGMWGYHCKDDGLVSISHTINSYNNVGTVLGQATTLALPIFPTTTETLAKTAHYDTSKKAWVYADGQNYIGGIPQYFATIYNKGGHGGWERMYEDPDLYTWVFKQYKH